MSAHRWPDAPPGFVRLGNGPSTLFAREPLAEELVDAGLTDEVRWTARLGVGGGPRGRGGTGRLDLPGGVSLVLKRLSRGGLAGRVRPDGFRELGRLLSNLVLPDVLSARGVPTPKAAALLLIRGRAGSFRGFLAVERIEGAEDLRQRWSRREAPAEDLRAVVSAVKRMHDAGFRHRDLNLGNLLLRGAPPEAFVIDLDGGSLDVGPLRPSRRAAELRRLERSYVKWFGDPGPLGAGGRARFWDLYAPDDPAIRSAVRRRRWTGRLAVAWHRLGWRTWRRERTEGRP